MFGSVRSSLARCATALTILTVFALVNPFCCHFMPYFQAEQAQAETAFDGVDKTCAGKPAAQREGLLEIGGPLPLAGWHQLVVAPVARPALPSRDLRERSAPPPALARHRLLGIYLV